MQDLKTLVIEARRGDLDAYSQIVRRFQDMAYGCGYTILGDFHLAEDAAQNAFIDAYRQLSKLSDPAAFPGWFRRIVITHCGRITRAKKVTTTSLDTHDTTLISSKEPADILEKREMQEKVLEAIRALPENQRMATTLFYINGYSQKEVAEFLEVPLTTVKKRLYDSRKKLKERMIDMVKETLKDNVPDERFSQKVIEELLGRPRPLEIEGHPMKIISDKIRNALADYEIVKGNEIVQKDVFKDKSIADEMHRIFDKQVYHVDGEKILRVSTSITLFNAIGDRTPPMQVLTVGRNFNTKTPLKVFHQLDAVRLGQDVNRDEVNTTCQKAVEAVFGSADFKWRNEDFGLPFAEHGMVLSVKLNDKWHDIGTSAVLTPAFLKTNYHISVRGIWFSLMLDAIAVIKFDLDDTSKLWQEPYVPNESCG